MFGLKIFVRVQTFRRGPPDKDTRHPNFCTKREKKPWASWESGPYFAPQLVRGYHHFCGAGRGVDPPSPRCASHVWKYSYEMFFSNIAGKWNIPVYCFQHMIATLEVTSFVIGMENRRGQPRTSRALNEEFCVNIKTVCLLDWGWGWCNVDGILNVVKMIEPGCQECWRGFDLVSWSCNFEIELLCMGSLFALLELFQLTRLTLYLDSLVFARLARLT